jgi:hypothetical protein
MIIMHESRTAYRNKTTKPVICPKCERGRLGSVPGHSEAVLSKRGRPPQGIHDDYVQIKCHICRSVWAFTFEL